MRTSRLEAFSDGVFAIAATLLVLELRVPPETSARRRQGDRATNPSGSRLFPRGLGAYTVGIALAFVAQSRALPSTA